MKMKENKMAPAPWFLVSAIYALCMLRCACFTLMCVCVCVFFGGKASRSSSPVWKLDLFEFGAGALMVTCVYCHCSVSPLFCFSFLGEKSPFDGLILA